MGTGTSLPSLRLPVANHSTITMAACTFLGCQVPVPSLVPPFAIGDRHMRRRRNNLAFNLL